MKIIMKILYLKITGIAILILSAIFLVKIFWPTESAPLTKKPESKQISEPVKAEMPVPIRQKESNRNAQKLYQRALLESEKAGDSTNKDYRAVIGSRRNIITNFTDSAEAEKAEQLLKEVPQKYRKRHQFRSRIPRPFLLATAL